MAQPSIPEFGRFAEPALLILVSLSEGPKHGYAIMADVEAGPGARWARAPSTRHWLDWRNVGSSRPSRPSIAAGHIGCPVSA